MEDTLVPIFVVGGLWVMIAAISISSIQANARNRRDMNDTMRRAIEAGQPLTPETISMLYKPTKSWEQDLRSWVILTCLAIGLALCGAINLSFAATAAAGDVDVSGSPQGFFIAAIIVGAIGVGQLVAAWLRRDRKA